MMAIARTAIFVLSFSGLILAQAQTPPASKPKPPAAPKPASTAAEDDVQIPPASPGSLFPAVVARVNSRPILGRDMEVRVQAQLAPLGNPEWKNLKEEYRQELVGTALGSLVAAELIYQKAVSAGMKATDAEIQAEFAKNAKSFASDAEMNIALANRGLDRAAYLKELSRSMTVEKFVSETIGKKVIIAAPEVDQYYSSHKSEFNHPELIRTSHILIIVPQAATAEQEKLAQQRAESVLARARKGEDFAKLAKEFSMDGSASNGGDIGLTEKGSLAPEYEQAAFKLPVGAISNVVRTQFGYHVIKVTEKKKEGVAPLEEVRASLTDFLKNQKVEAELGKTVETLRTAAKIEVLIPLSPSQRTGATTSSPRP